MIIGLSLIEVVINTLWLKLDHIQCDFSTGQVSSELFVMDDLEMH